ncbi:hypothetical protein ATE92_1000 [Ulvibacter sp. MAR_2010_11]|uniref:hypothetical protein n=1 Tax=Ulvibacter sp. MAR_2010_11 TaxID=1250229 RepID=UPI000C2CA8C6|nr:hypothetical protein [Ulvibacter sp. MAR_2010_11]PKA82860.1 hypothetical protein ATE92_1000 [Ulvibacter sp. MAR_2010_11]
MKNLKSIAAFFLLLSFLLGSGNAAFAFTETLAPQTTHEQDVLKATSNSKALIFEEVSASKINQSLSENEPGLLGLYFSQSGELFYTPVSECKEYASSPFRDHRRLLEQVLFPFHFFW